MEDLEKKYIDNSLRVISTYIDCIGKITNNCYNYDNVLDQRSKIELKMDTVNFKNELKLSLLSTLFSNNYDLIIETVDDEIKKRIIENQKIKKVNSVHSFEDGNDFEIGKGLRIIKINPKTVGNYDKILILIRNSIAHSKFILDDDQIHITNRDFEAILDIKWLEMLTLSIFSNSNINDKKGANDGMLFLNNLENISITSEQELKKILKNSNYLNITYKRDQNVYMQDLIIGLGRGLSKYKNKGEILSVLKQFNEIYDNSFDFDLHVLSADFLKMMQNTNFFFYNMADMKYYLLAEGNIETDLDYEEVNSDTYDHQCQALADMHAVYTSVQKRNTISYKYILEFIDLLEKGNLTQFNIFDKNIIFFTNIMQQLLIKAYNNVIFNYMMEKNKDVEFDIVSNLKTKYTFPDYIKLRTSSIKDLRNLLSGNLGGNEPIKITNKINKLLQEIEDYKLGRTDINLLLNDKFRNAFVHGNVDFNPVYSTEELIIRDYDGSAKNFKLQTSSNTVLHLAHEIYTQLDISKQK